jgi:hypothetical protein
MYSLAAKLLQVTVNFVATGPLAGVTEQAGSGDGVGPVDVTVNVAEPRPPDTLPTASTLWSPTVASAGTTKPAVALPVAVEVIVDTGTDEYEFVNHLMVTLSPAP